METKPTYPITLSGKTYEMRFDIMALTGAQSMLKSLGYPRPTVWTLADAPYDLGEEVILLQAGLNGAKRLQKDRKLYEVSDVQELLQDHFEFIATRLDEEPDEEEAMKKLQEEQSEVMKAIAEAVKGAIGFRYKGGRKSQ